MEAAYCKVLQGPLTEAARSGGAGAGAGSLAIPMGKGCHCVTILDAVDNMLHSGKVPRRLVFLGGITRDDGVQTRGKRQ